jgi:ABC-type multidrug transport system ATPase subunit
MIIRDTPIMVLDDSLSAVDAETDAKIRAALSEYMGKRTVILISHRISTLRAADQILVLKDGKVSGLGTHEELMQSNEIYRKVAEIQSAGLEEVYETVGSVTNKETDPPEGEPKETIAETNPARPDGQVAMDLEQKKEETGVSKAGEEAQHE